MKKIIFTAALVSFGMMSQAQIFVGGQLGFNSNSTKFKSDKTDKVSALTIAPMVGYQLDDKLAAGVRLNLNTQKAIEFEANGSDDGIDKTTTFGAEVFAQYTFLQFDKFSVYAEAALGFASVKNKSELGDVENENKGSRFGFSVAPCLAYSITEQVSLIANLDFLSLGFTSTKSGDVKNGAFNIGVNGLSPVTIGLIYKL
ncbi:MAG: porin family protein [Bacteroidales bacterium]|jgi:opacity protein-like surface antigen|nr:porin family protein [Bacteroidales bacterium]